ncbi:MGMT family protein [Candidatus Dojkabacteria bacterium]|uniref:MGMT family protein n=1 Tax=Candidatus Dojkabacteria bacterium TaxID=2099670 RepID=A0A955RJW6_9BACT|nr:MGMT family protein [Candidatus Dojkabacteria bacterium]
MTQGNYKDKKAAVYSLLTRIPKGKVVTYGQIAEALELPTPRLVGRILHQNNEPEKYPCHRVVFADGKLSPAYAFGGDGVQRRKLEYEGVIFKKLKVNLEESRHTFSLGEIERNPLF